MRLPTLHLDSNPDPKLGASMSKVHVHNFLSKYKCRQICLESQFNGKYSDIQAVDAPNEQCGIINDVEKNGSGGKIDPHAVPPCLKFEFEFSGVKR